MNKDILLVSSEFPPMPGGIGNHAFYLAKELTAQSHRVDVLTERREAEAGTWERFLADNADINVIAIRRRFVIAYTYLERLITALSLLRRTHYAAIIYSGKFPVWMSSVVPRRKSVVVVHGSEIKQNGLSKVLFRRGLMRAGKIVCVSNFTMSQMLSTYPEIDPGKVSVINNGIGDDWLAQAQPERTVVPETISLITVGGIHRRKGQGNVIRALPEILKYFPNLRYHIVGIPGESGDLRRLIRELDVGDHVEFHHGLDNGKMKKLLRECDVFVMLSEHLESGDFEGFGIAILEAMSVGLPAIGTKNSGIADAISDGYSGRLVDPQNAREVCEALTEIVNDYQRYSANAFAWAKKFRWQRKVSEYRQIIDSL